MAHRITASCRPALVRSGRGRLRLRPAPRPDQGRANPPAPFIVVTATRSERNSFDLPVRSTDRRRCDPRGQTHDQICPRPVAGTRRGRAEPPEHPGPCRYRRAASGHARSSASVAFGSTLTDPRHFARRQGRPQLRSRLGRKDRGDAGAVLDALRNASGGSSRSSPKTSARAHAHAERRGGSYGTSRSGLKFGGQSGALTTSEALPTLRRPLPRSQRGRKGSRKRQAEVRAE